MEKSGVKIAAQNRKAFHDYFVEARCEAGIELFGTEVKSIRAGTLNLKDAFCVAKDGEVYAYSFHISPYDHGNIFNRDPDRPKRQCKARFFVDFSGNIAIPTGGTVGAISLAIAISGEPVLSSQMISTPAAVNQYNNVSAGIYIDVPRGCCVNIAVENTSDQAISVANANIVVTREA